MKAYGVLVDTSVLIPFFQGKRNEQVDHFVKMVQDDMPVYLCPVVIQEALQGIRSDRQFEEVKAGLLAFPIIEWEPVEAFVAAAQLYRALRKRGIKIRRSNDCLVGAYARQANLSVLHMDRDFSQMVEAGVIPRMY